MAPRPEFTASLDSKNIDCPFYTTCLDHAARQYWPSWDCSKCEHRSDREKISLDGCGSGPALYLELPSELYRRMKGEIRFM
jgi:hypothetical protein